MWRYVFCSLILHGSCVLLFWFLSSRKHAPLTTTTQVEFIERTSQKVSPDSSPAHSRFSGSAAPQKGFKRERALKRHLKLKNLLPRFGIGQPSRKATGLQGVEENWEDDVSSFANQMDTKTQLETMHFYQQVWNKINEKFYYPIELAELYISGDVVVHVEVDRRGTFKGQLLKIQATNPLLEAFVLGVVMQGLKLPLQERFWHTDEKLIPLSLTFHFGTYIDKIVEPKGGALKNRLQFERFVRMEPKLNKTVRDFFIEHKIPPLIPIPGGAMLDVVLAVQILQSIGKPGPKQLDQIKRDRLKEQFQSTLKETLNR